ncbi:hypothetical protein MMC22_004359 [Lobaria immixta]|nr:hypothetical protein [Lobaria immixta]
MPVRKIVRKFNRCASCRFKRFFRYASTHHKSSRNKTPPFDSDERVQTPSSQISSGQTFSGENPSGETSSGQTPSDQHPSESPQSEGGPSHRSQVGSVVSYQWIPNIATINDPESPILSIRNPDLNSITPSLEEPVTESDIFEASENFDEESINTDRPDRLFERPNVLLAVRNPGLESKTSLLGEEVTEADVSDDPDEESIEIKRPQLFRFGGFTSFPKEEVAKDNVSNNFDELNDSDEESINIDRPDHLFERPKVLLTVRNPDLDSTTSLLGEEVTEADVSDDSDEEIIEINRPNFFRVGGSTFFQKEEVSKANVSNIFDELNDSDEESIEIDWPDRFRVERPSSRLAKAIEREQLKKFRDGVITDFRPILPRIAEESYPIIVETFTTSPPVTPPTIPLGQESTKHVEKSPNRHVSWNLPKPSRRTFLQRMTDKLQARVSRESSSPDSSSDGSGRRPSSLYPGSSQERASYGHCEPLNQSSCEAHKPRPILKLSTRPSQPQALVHELESFPPKTLVRKKACHNLAMAGLAPISTGITDSPTVVERSDSLTSEPDIIDFAAPPSTPIVGLSTPALISPSQSPIFMTAPSSSVTLNRANSPLSSLGLAIQVKHRDHEVRVEARLRTQRAEVRFLTKKLRHAKRESSEVEMILWEALLGIKRAKVRSLTKELRRIKQECSEVEAILLSGNAARSRRFHGGNH